VAGARPVLYSVAAQTGAPFTLFAKSGEGNVAENLSALSQASAMYAPCFVNSSRLWASLSCMANALSLRHTSRMSLEIEVDRGNEVGRSLGAKPCANMPEIEDSGE
jgi:hypothetical protein